MSEREEVSEDHVTLVIIFSTQYEVHQSTAFYTTDIGCIKNSNIKDFHIGVKNCI